MVYSKLKSLKTFKVLPNGCIFVDYVAYIKTYQRYVFLKKYLFANLSNHQKFKLSNSNFFYKKYRI